VGAVVDVDDAALPPGRCCAAFLGHDVHAGVCVPARDRMRLARLARYAGRPRQPANGRRYCPTAGCSIGSSTAGGTQRRTSSMSRWN
jgi:hypothetical protein